METETDIFAKAILNAPAWARVGITAPTEAVREAAAQELALQIGKLVSGDDIGPDPRQMPLPLKFVSSLPAGNGKSPDAVE